MPSFPPFYCFLWSPNISDPECFAADRNRVVLAQMGDLEGRMKAAEEKARVYRDCGEQLLLAVDEEAPPAGESSRDFASRLAGAPRRLRAALRAAAQDAAALVLARCRAFYPAVVVDRMASGWPEGTEPESVADRVAEMEERCKAVTDDLGL